MRRYQQEQAIEHGWVDASGHLTFARLRNLCMPYVRLKGQRMSPVRQVLMRNQVVEVARGHFAGQGTLGEVSDAALGDVLEQLIKEMASTPGEVAHIIDWMLDRPRQHKLYQLGTLFSVWRAIIKQEGYVDALDINAAILKLLRGNRDAWPPLLRDARKITFRSVRWLNPFEESCVLALNHTMKVRVESALPPAHSESSADRLGQRIQMQIMAEPWAAWAEDLGDAMAVDCAGLIQLEQGGQISFSRSSGAYGEVEDLARRIAWHLQEERLTPNRIALVVPNISVLQDIIPHVFGRFGIPYFFRRGRPVLSSPCVKAFLAWLAFPIRPERDELIDLLRNPAIHFPQSDGVVDALRKAPPRINPASYTWLHSSGACSGCAASEMLNERMTEPEDHFNREALQCVRGLLDSLGDHAVPLDDLIDLVEELLENATVRPRESHEQGVWVINPHDAVGLEFDLVLFAGLNEGEFPSVPSQDALLSDDERAWLRRHLEEKGRHLPVLALPKADALFEQQSVLFLSALGMTRKRLVLSYQSADQDGNEKSPGEYFRKVWELAGWPAQEMLNPGPYDQWRMQRLDDDNLFLRHLNAQQQTAPEDRMPMPGESYLTIVPLALCRARDEALQSAVSLDEGAVPPSGSDEDSAPSAPLEHLVSMLRIEAEREAFLDAPVDKRMASVYCGHVPALQGRIADWLESKNELSPTALEKLAQCRYLFLIEQVFGLRDETMADDTPDPLERGSLVHVLLKKIYTAFADGSAGLDIAPLWAVQTQNGWRRRTDGGIGAIPLVVFDAARTQEYVDFAEATIRREFDQVALGYPGVWVAEREKILMQILNFVRYDAQTCAAEGRYPALFEHRFAGESAVELAGLRIRGTIDRLDLLFDAGGALTRVRVLDYKGSSRARRDQDAYIDEIRRNLDCQLPVYALAAQQHFFGEVNTDCSNAMTEAGYLFYERDFSKIGGALKKSLVPMDAPDLLPVFLETLNKNVQRLKDGDFAVDPLIASYNDYESICRTTAVNREELD